ncbi:MAG TPA: hypothetical protein VID24_03085 [Candidatus Eremiobacteraceae bacterium]
MLSYTIDGKILRLIVSGDVSLAERRSVYDAVRDDPNVPDDCVLVVDARDASVTFRDATIDVRVHALLEGLGKKFGRTCAFIESGGDPLYAKHFNGPAQSSTSASACSTTKIAPFAGWAPTWKTARSEFASPTPATMNATAGDVADQWLPSCGPM